MKKIMGILVMMLLITTAFTAIGIKIDNIVESSDTNDNKFIMSVCDYVPKFPPFGWLIGSDQKQTSNCNYGDEIAPPFVAAQEFKPTKDKLTAVALGFFKHNPPSGVEITVSIRDALDGSDLTTKTIDADKANIKSKETWVLFDFTDITVTPETTYYIVCSANGGMENESYLWLFDINNKYDRGIAWFSIDNGLTWFDLEEIPGFPEMDFCFITYWQKPKNRAININEPISIDTVSPKQIVSDLPEYFNWMDYEGQDWTTSAKDQGACGSCYLFTALGSLESVINIREGIADLDIDLSEQYVLSCLTHGGCSGGLSWTVFDRIYRNDSTGNNCNGIIPEICFPYQADDTIPCESKSDNWGNYLIPIEYYEMALYLDNNEIKSKIMQYGPISTAIFYVKNFEKWVLTNHNPDDYYPYDESTSGVGHNLLIVGWKDDPSIGKGGYWIIKNSWGTVCGYNGFFNMEYGSLNIGGQTHWVDYDPSSYDWHPVPKAHGPYFGLVNEPVPFKGDASGEHPPFTYYWDFGDDSYSEDQNPTHIYTSEGEYDVTLTVTDDQGNSFYDETYAWIQETNQPPDTPVLEGAKIANAGAFYSYSFTAYDPDTPIVYCYRELFGDDLGVWSDSFLSSDKKRFQGWWAPEDSGSYTIRWKLKDPYGAESDWATLKVIVLKNKEVIYRPILNFLQQHPNCLHCYDNYWLNADTTNFKFQQEKKESFTPPAGRIQKV
jgi:C1A family cysteine protease